MEAAVCLAVPAPAATDYQRHAAEQHARAEGLARSVALSARQHQLSELKYNLAQSQASLEQQRLQRDAQKRQLALGQHAAQLGVDLAKNRVDLHRWRQRTALLKVRLSSAHEDADRYRRMGDLLRRQAELEVAARRGCRIQAAALAQQALALAGRMREHTAHILALQADLLRLQEMVAAKDHELAAQHEAMVTSSDQTQAALAQAQAVCVGLQEQLAAVQERAKLADQTATAAQERANLAEQTLRQKEALLAEKDRFQADVQHFSQDLQKLARETSSVVDGKLQEQLTAAHAQLFEEQRRRVDAEGDAQVQRAKAEQVQREVERLRRSLAARDSLIQQLKTARLNDTPARQVTQTMELVGSLAADLAGTPATNLLMRQRSAAAAAAVEQAEAAGPSNLPLAAAEGVQAKAAAGKKRGKQKVQADGQQAGTSAMSAKVGKQVAAIPAQPEQQPAPADKKAAGKKVVPAAAENEQGVVEGGSDERKKKNSNQAAAAKAERRAAAVAAAVAQDTPGGSSSSWDEEEDSGADPNFTESKLRGGGKSKKQQQQPQPVTASGAAADGTSAAAGARSRRERKQAGQYWLGGGEQGPASPPREEEKEQEDEPHWADARSPQAAVEGTGEGIKKRKKAAVEQPRLADKHCPEVEAAVGGTKEGSKKRKKATDEQRQEGTSHKISQEGGSGSGKAAKRPKQGSLKQLDAISKKAAAAGLDKENGEALNALSAAAEHEQRRQVATEDVAAKAASAVPTSRLEQRPLSALTDRVLEAAAQRASMGHMPITAQLQKVIAAQSSGSNQGRSTSQPQHGKRKLLSVSSGITLPGEALPAHRMFGAAKVPRQASNNHYNPAR